MSIVAKCDRCGKVVNGINGGPSPILLSWRSDIIAYMDKAHPIFPGQTVHVILPLLHFMPPNRDEKATNRFLQERDLCSDCLDALDNFMRHPDVHVPIQDQQAKESEI